MAQAHTFLHPRGWKTAKGFSNGVVAEGRTIFLAGQVGWNAEQQFESGDFVAQARQALANIVTLVAQAAALLAKTRAPVYVLPAAAAIFALSRLGV